jgi:hypothetical protein
MFGFALGELAFGELPAFDTPYLRLIRDPVSRFVFLVEIYPYQF